jgi:chorismate dehydratase
MSKPYIAASSYLNAAPLCYSFRKGQQRLRCRFISDAAPARCAELLSEGQADAALIPVIEYQRIPALKVVFGACVSSNSSVRSVVIASRVPIEAIRTVALDISSRTSAALVQIILDRFYGLSARYKTSPPRIAEMLESADAALIIGDPAMLIDHSRLYVYDLAELWRKHTGLPFVFAFWAIRSVSVEMFAAGKLSVTHCVDFAAAKSEGIAHIEEIAEEYAARLALPKEEIISYLTENISYDLDEDKLRSLSLYYELAHACGLIEGVRELEFYGST